MIEHMAKVKINKRLNPFNEPILIYKNDENFIFLNNPVFRHGIITSDSLVVYHSRDVHSINNEANNCYYMNGYARMELRNLRMVLCDLTNNELLYRNVRLNYTNG